MRGQSSEGAADTSYHCLDVVMEVEIAVGNDGCVVVGELPFYLKSAMYVRILGRPDLYAITTTITRTRTRNQNVQRERELL